MNKMTWGRRLVAIGTAFAISVGLATAAYASSMGSSTVSISDEYGVAWNCQFNPYSGADQFDSFGVIYEELVYVDALENGATTPWLATAWAWSNSDRTLTFTIRSGVKWSDGVPFSAKDVVYSFNLLKQNPALDLNGDWTVLSSVTQKGSNQVVMQFKKPAVPYFYYIADETPIVPEHLWSSVKDPVTYLDKNPIGTGPYVLHTCNGANIQYTKNAHYWQAGLPKIETVNFPSYLSNDAANADLASGVDQWGSQYIPNIKAYYLSKSKYYHYWFEPVYNVNIYINLDNSILSNLAVRQAMAYAINRQAVSTIGESGYEPASNQTSIVKPTFAGWYDTAQAAQYGNAYAYDPAKAISILKAAGYKKGSNGIFAKNGKELAFTIINNGGYSDWVAAVNVIETDLKAVGISITPDNLADTTWLSDLYTGRYQLAYSWDSGGPTPYYELRALLYSGNTAPIGQSAADDWERYISPATDSLFTEYASTTSSAVQHTVIDELQKVMLDDVPVIPVTEAVDWYQYDTQSLGGWVTPSDAYAQPNQYAVPDWGVVLLHLYAK